MYRGTIVIPRDGYINYTSHPGDKQPYRMNCVYSIISAEPAAIKHQFCNINCARCSIHQVHDTNLHMRYWVLETCGCKHYANQLYVLDESNNLSLIPLDSDPPTLIPTI